MLALIIAPLALTLAAQDPPAEMTPVDGPDAATTSTSTTPTTPTTPPAPTTTASTPPKATSLGAFPGAQWSVGAGLTLSSETSVDLTVERRLGESLWLLVDATGAFGQDTFTAEPVEQPFGNQVTRSDSSSISGSLSTGARWAILQTEHVILSPYGVVGAGVTTADTTRKLASYDPTADDFTESNQDENSFAWSVFLTGGLAIDVPFADVLAFRIATDVVGVSYRQAHTERRDDEDAPPIVGDDGELFVGLDLEPSFQLRVFF